MDDVIDWMTRIHSVLSETDGLKWFNWLYLEVTKAVRNQPAGVDWKNLAWLSRLDVIFANFYFAAIESVLNGKPTAKSWGVLFEARSRPTIDRIQFALAGINAHINHDLSLALIDANKEFGINPGHSSGEHSDFEQVNALLENVLPLALNTLATGLIGQLIQDTGKIGRLLAMWNVRAARDLAWDFGSQLRILPKPSRDFALASQDQLTGALGRSILLMV